MGLEGGEGVGLLGEHQAALGRVAAAGRLVVEEFPIPNLLLGFPAHDEALLDRPAEGQFAKIATFFQLGPDVCLSEAVAREAVGDDPRAVGLVARHKPGLDRVGAIVEHEGRRLWRRTRSLRFSACWHGTLSTLVADSKLFFVEAFWRLVQLLWGWVTEKRQGPAEWSMPGTPCNTH